MGERGEEEKALQNFFFFDCLHFFSPECFAHKLFLRFSPLPKLEIH